MESVLGSVAFWLGSNAEFILKAAVGSVLGVLAVRAAFGRHGRVDSAVLFAVGVGVFFVVYAYFAYRQALGLTYLWTENRVLSYRMGAAFASIALVSGVVGVLLRRSRRIAFAVCGAGLLLAGTSPTVVRTLPRPSGVSRSASTAAPVQVQAPPVGYPTAATWTNEEEGLFARFPSTPQRLVGATTGASVRAYQSPFAFDDGRALAQVTVSQLPGQAAAQDVSDVLKSAHTGYLGSVGALPENSTTTRGTLGDGTAILFFDVKLKVRDELMVSHGFWAYSRARIIRVAVTYSTSLSPAHTAVARYFPQTFGLVTR